MAKKTLSTRQKMVFRLPATRPRNPLALRARQRVAGAHRKDSGAVRSAQRRALKKALGGDEGSD